MVAAYPEPELAHTTMNRFAASLYGAALALIINIIPAAAQSASDFQVLEKQIQDLQAKVNKLQKEQADMTVNYSGTGGATKDVIEESKIKLSAGVTQLKLYGDLRFRYQYDDFHPAAEALPLATEDRNRFRFRLRIGADVQLGDQFFANVTLATGAQADSNNVTYTEGYDNNYPVYVDKAFAGWTPNDWFTIIMGKQANPFYTTDLVWDPNVTPAGVVEVFDISKAFLPDNSRLSLQLVSMQGAYFDGSSFTVGSDSAWQFVEQLKGTYSFSKDVSVTFAPGFMTYTAASISGLQNTVAFTKPVDVLPAPNGVQTQTTTTTTTTETVKYASNGQPSITLTPVNTTTTVTTTTPATGATRSVTTTTSNNQTQVTIPFGKPGNNLPVNTARANLTYVTTNTSGGGTTTVTSPTGQAPAAETADLAIITAPGDVSFRLGGIPSKLFWDFAYNTEGEARATNEYFLTTHTSEDDFAWLAGFQLGENARAGDWSANVDYRRIGMDSIDPNLDDDTFDLSYLNIQGFNLRVAYNVTDSFVAAIRYAHCWALRSGITGGEATGGAALANAKTTDIFELDLNLKF